MKRIPILLATTLILTMMSCQQEDPAAHESAITEAEAIGFRSPPGKVFVCHLTDDGSYEARLVPEPAVQGHLGHGDYLPDADGDGYTAIGACAGSGDDCDDQDDTIYPGATEIPDDGIDQDCDGEDATSLYCPCFSAAKLDSMLDVSWSWGWWSDVPGCKDAPYDQLLELWITNAGLPNQNFNFSAQAGTIAGSPFASSAIFNHQTNQFDLLCGGYTSAEIAEPCRQILSNFIQGLRVSHPAWDYCVRVP